MKTKNIFKALALAMLMPAMMLTTACSNEDDAINNGDNKKGYPLQVTVNVTRQGDKATTRATYNDNGDGTGSLTFSAGDKLFVEGQDNGGAGNFAGVLDYAPATGKFSGTIYTQNEWTGTVEELFAAANEDQNPYVPTFIATLLPVGYGDYGFLRIDDKGDAYAYNDRVVNNDNYTLATSKAAGVEQLSWEEATVYDNGFALAPSNAILNFTVTGLEGNTDVNVFVGHTDDRYNGTKTIRTDNDGNATFVACFPWGNDLQKCSVTVDGTPITIVSSEKNVQKGKIYNITRAKPTAVVWNLSDAVFSGTVSFFTGFTHEGVKLQGGGALDEGNLNPLGSTGLTFTNTLGKKFKSIVISTEEYGMADIGGDGWSGGTWTGDATSVTITGGHASGITSITFLLGD